MYLSEHPAVALVEALANLRGDPRLFPLEYQLMKVNVPETLKAVTLPEIPKEWREDPSKSRVQGDAWLAEGRSALLAVPSAPSPESLNYLLNPRHPDARTVTVEWTRSYLFDKRLFHMGV